MVDPSVRNAPPLVSVVLPARDEADTIAEVVLRVAAALEQNGWTYEILLGDSASSDDTVARALRADPSIRVVPVDRPGKGLVLTSALRQARGEILAFMDSDLDLAPEDLPALIRAVRAGAGCAAGAKMGAALAARPALRRLASRAVNAAARLVLRSGLQDHQTGMKAFDGTAMRAILPDVKEEGWLWDTEVLWRLARSGSSLVQVPVTLHGARDRAFNQWRSRIGGLAQLLSLYARLSREASGLAAPADPAGAAPPPR